MLRGKAKLPVQSVMIDRCIWNYQNATRPCESLAFRMRFACFHGQKDGDCGNPLFNCSIIQVHHKPTHRPENDRLCGKLKFHKGGWTGEVRPAFTAPPPPKVEQEWLGPHEDWPPTSLVVLIYEQYWQ